MEKQILYLIASAQTVEAKELIAIYETRGVSAQVIRNSLARLKKAGYIEAAARSLYAITPLGSEFIRYINSKAGIAEQQWDGSWQVVMFEVPETERSKRDGFRSGLLQLGFVSIYKGVYISPWEYTGQVVALGEQYELGERLMISSSRFTVNEISAAKAADLWSLAELQELYNEKQQWLTASFQPHLASLLTSERHDDNGLALIIKFLELGDVIAELSLRDPMLPAQLLPHDWPGTACYAELQRTLRAIALAIPANSPYRKFVTRILKV
ncbi:PaaX family transcriptional regulator C-terminal domain-containing protein [Paenibacillus sp. NEAU-GSW1]|uniref:PaaX family transcriptional regulator C-terminal domain-containing protein n=1 Tax=Paenibacillus sp. NEAU-GSW1 TaxID=2682486 RepID=UPI0020A65E15|nr:PaaX family transcriptional regulator C-terminal domain-containing protein [Paenibacillus sp. NEAU-GSW1]